MSELEIPIIYSRIISSAAGRTPAAIHQVLEGTGLDDNQGKSMSGYMHNAQYEQLLRNARRVSGDPLITLRAGAHLPMSVHGPLAIAATTSPSVRVAIETLSQYTKLRSPFCEITLKGEGEKSLMGFVIKPVLGDQGEAALDFILASIGCSIPNIGCRLPISFTLTLTRPEPNNAKDYKQLLGCDVIYEQPQNAFIFDEADMGIELLGASEKQYTEAVEQLKRILNAFNLSGSTQERVNNLFNKNTGQLCTLEYIAQNMLISPRTLQRQLRTEDVSFQGLRDEWLSQQAMNYLTLDNLSVEVTAVLLGYSDTANFRRSFKRWFGQPPSHYTQ